MNGVEGSAGRKERGGFKGNLSGVKGDFLCESWNIRRLCGEVRSWRYH